jgi:hypothetical protein
MYLQCKSFSHNKATNECRVTVGLMSTSNATLLTVKVIL